MSAYVLRILGHISKRDVLRIVHLKKMPKCQIMVYSPDTEQVSEHF